MDYLPQQGDCIRRCKFFHIPASFLQQLPLLSLLTDQRIAHLI